MRGPHGNDPQHNARALKFWSDFTKLFPGQFVKKNGPPAGDQFKFWARDIGNLTREAYEFALEQFKREPGKYSPSVREILLVAWAYVPPVDRQDRPLSLPLLKAQKAVRKDNWRRIQSILKGKGDPGPAASEEETPPD